MKNKKKKKFKLSGASDPREICQSLIEAISYQLAKQLGLIKGEI